MSLVIVDDDDDDDDDGDDEDDDDGRITFAGGIKGFLFFLRDSQVFFGCRYVCIISGIRIRFSFSRPFPRYRVYLYGYMRAFANYLFGTYVLYTLL